MEDALKPNIAKLFEGKVELERGPIAQLLCPFLGKNLPLSRNDLLVLSELSGEQWLSIEDASIGSGVRVDRIATMVAQGIVLADDGNALTNSILAAEERADRIGWHPLALTYQSSTRWFDSKGDEGSRDHSRQAHRDRLQEMMERNGPPPTHFYSREDAVSNHALPREAFDDDDAALFRARRTCRHFDQRATLSQSSLGRVLRGTFGPLGTQELLPDVIAVKKASASGGALHPIGAYPLIARVEGVAPGFYHYRQDSHELQLVLPLSEEGARTLITELTAGQVYFSEAHAVVFMVARISRNHWKYRYHPKALKAVFMDAGHLSQTFYLLAAQMGLGAFFTGAVNDGRAGELLLLDPLEEAVIGANGLGIVDATRDTLNMAPTEFAPVRDD